MDSILPPRITYIYGLVDPRTCLLRYIGKSNDPRIRYRKHINQIDRTHKSLWIQQLRSNGLLPWLLILDVVPFDGWQQYEMDWISIFRGQLTNITEGGDAPDITTETRNKMRLAKLGKVPNNKGQKTSLEARAKQSIAAKLRYERMSDDDLELILERLRTNPPDGSKLIGRHHSDEARLKISQAQKGNKRSALLTKAQVLEIVSRIQNGNVVQNELAKEYGVSFQVISHIKHGRTYMDWTGIINSDPIKKADTK